MTTPSPDSTEPKPSPRRRWHAVAIVVTVLSLAVGTFLNIPGQPVVGPDILAAGKTSPNFNFYTKHIAHGWPFYFFTHAAPSKPTFGMSPRGFTNRDVVLPAVYVPQLLANALLILTGSITLGWLFHRRINRHGYRFGLASIAILFAAIGTLLAYGTYRYRLQRAQLQVLENSQVEIHSQYHTWEPFGPAWLRSLTGEAYWSWGDRIVRADPRSLEGEFIDSFPGRSTVKVLRPWSINLDAPPSLDGYDQLVAIDLSWTRFMDNEGNYLSDPGNADLEPLLHSIANCPTLEGLSLPGLGLTDEDLKQLSAMSKLKHLYLCENMDITDAGLTHLASIKSLQKLGLNSLKVTPEGRNKLQSELPSCDIYQGWWNIVELDSP